MKIVHRINEFQAGYYIISIYSRLLKYNFEYLGAQKFLNGLFVCRYIQESEKKDSNAYRMTSLIKNNNYIQATINAIRKDLNEIKNEIKASPASPEKVDKLTDLIGSIKINE